MGRLERILSRDDGLSKQARNRRDRNVRRWVDRNTGMCHTHLQLDAETDARVAAALDAAIAAAKTRQQDSELTFDQLQADTLVDLITRTPGTASNNDRRVPEVIVLIDLDTLRTGLHDHGVAETADGNPLPADTIRRMCCDADIIPTVLDANGVTIDVGRERRVATRHQRRALRAMHTSCAHPDCTVRFDNCQIHHVTPWEHGGRSDLDNLLPLCSTHHHLVHEGRWTLTLNPDRTIELRRPDGTTHYTGTTITRAPDGPRHHRRHLERNPGPTSTARSRPTSAAPPARPEPPTTSTSSATQQYADHPTASRPPEHPQHERHPPPDATKRAHRSVTTRGASVRRSLRSADEEPCTVTTPPTRTSSPAWTALARTTPRSARRTCASCSPTTPSAASG